MIKKRNSFFTFIFSSIPGGGQMFMGFMKLGLFLLTTFMGVCAIAALLHIEAVLFILPIIWFYSFFDCLNKMSLTQEQLTQLKDEYPVKPEQIRAILPGIFPKYNLAAAIVLICIGVSILWENFFDVISEFIPDVFYNQLWRLSDAVPQLVIGLLIIYLGLKLIAGKKKELNNQQPGIEEKEVH